MIGGDEAKALCYNRSNMAKNIVICCDGTGNEYGAANSNVVRIFQCTVRDAAQIAYYDPGVGTMAAPQAISRAMQWLTWKFGLAFGFGLQRNVGEAYTYLMNSYEPEDRIFLFGFSRGAYTVRALAAMLFKVGLLERGSDNQIPYAYRMFQGKTNFALAGGYRKTFARKCPVHFVGVWDTVSTVGWVYNPATLPYTARNPGIGIFRHAISIDEQRTHFRTNLFRPEENQDCKQVWFAGVHADVGGGYPEAESGLSKITLRWMAQEAQEAGLRLDGERFDDIALGEGERYAKPDVTARQHDELVHWGWRLIEHLPRRFIDMKEEPPTVRWAWAPFSGFYRERLMVDPLVHESVEQRKAQVATYRPKNLPGQYVVERDKMP